MLKWQIEDRTYAPGGEELLGGRDLPILDELFGGCLDDRGGSDPARCHSCSGVLDRGEIAIRARRAEPAHHGQGHGEDGAEGHSGLDAGGHG